MECISSYFFAEFFNHTNDGVKFSNMLSLKIQYFQVNPFRVFACVLQFLKTEMMYS